jgi:translation initiation factor IF-2
MTTSVREFAANIRIPVERLVQQLAEAGVESKAADDPISDDEKSKLLLYLRRAHGSEAVSVTPRRVTLTRQVVTELRQSDTGRRGAAATGRGARVTVVTKKSRTYVKRDEASPAAQTAASEPQEAAFAPEAEVPAEVPVVAPAQVEPPAGAAEAPPPAPELPAAQAAPEPVVASAPVATPAPSGPPPAEARGPKPERKGPAPAQERGRKRKGERGAEGDDALSRIRRRPRGRDDRRAAAQQSRHGFERPVGPVTRDIEVPASITVADLAARMSVRAAELIRTLMKMGQLVTINQTLDQDTAMLVVEEMGHRAVTAAVHDPEADLDAQAVWGESRGRPPIVTVMGHVDHGKTSLLDYIRKSRVAEGEAGHITQHIGAYHVQTPRGVVTFLDTPGHEAFSAMRARGASLTDIVVLVVAADDGPMPQTIEALQHARAAGVPLVVAVNKVDKAGADPERVKQGLSQHEVIPEDWGGDTQFVPVSALTGQGVDDLLEAILVQAEVMELAAPAQGPARGVVVESELDRGRGPVATVLVQRGTLRKGDLVLAGTQFGRARMLFDEAGRPLDEVGPSRPATVLGLSGVPNVGDPMAVVEDERQARDIASFRAQRARDAALAKRVTAPAADIFEQLRTQQAKQLNVIVKADVQGSAEAIVASLERLSTDEVAVRVVGSGVGAITETDANLAQSAGALLVGFNVRPDAAARRIIKEAALQVRYHSIIYELLDEVKRALSGMLEPEVREEIVGLAQVRQVFRSQKFGAVAGCLVVEGVVRRRNPIRVLRNSVVVFEGELESLRRIKDDVQEVRAGTECGIGVRGYDVHEGDQIECFARVRVERSL